MWTVFRNKLYTKNLHEGVGRAMLFLDNHTDIHTGRADCAFSSGYKYMDTPYGLSAPTGCFDLEVR